MSTQPPRVPSPTDVPDEWDFYPCKVDDAPASIFLNMSFANRAPVESADTLCWLIIRMREPDGHGMGTASEAAVLGPVEDSVASEVTAGGVFFVGRLRNKGIWQCVFYGPPGCAERVADAARRLVEPTERDFETGTRPDRDWTCYRAFLFPDEERHQWMLDRRVVDRLAEEGDPLTQPRRIDHWSYFADKAQRGAFVEEARALGFAVQAETEGNGPADRPFGAQIHRVDSVKLEEVHQVAWALYGVARRHGGEYDGWETSVEKSAGS